MMDILDTRENLNAMVLCHEQQIKDIAAHLLELKQLVTPMMEFKRREWVGLTDEKMQKLADAHLCYQEESPELSGVYKLIRAVELAHGIGEKD